MLEVACSVMRLCSFFCSEQPRFGVLNDVSLALSVFRPFTINRFWFSHGTRARLCTGHGLHGNFVHSKVGQKDFSTALHQNHLCLNYIKYSIKIFTCQIAAYRMVFPTHSIILHLFRVDCSAVERHEMELGI